MNSFLSAGVPRKQPRPKQIENLFGNPGCTVARGIHQETAEKLGLTMPLEVSKEKFTIFTPS